MLELSEYLEVLEYDKETGFFTWKIKPCKNQEVGSIAGTLHKATGYIKITYKGHKVSAHRLAWAFINGKWPENQIDHKNNDRSDNRYCNLRQANTQQNMLNRIISSNNTSGIKGVYPIKNKWASKIVFNGVRYWLGLHENIRDAENAVVEKRNELHGIFANHGNISTKG